MYNLVKYGSQWAVRRLMVKESPYYYAEIQIHIKLHREVIIKSIEFDRLNKNGYWIA